MKNTTAIIIITASLKEKDILGWKNTLSPSMAQIKNLQASGSGVFHFTAVSRGNSSATGLRQYSFTARFRKSQGQLTLMKGPKFPLLELQKINHCWLSKRESHSGKKGVTLQNQLALEGYIMIYILKIKVFLSCLEW